MARGTPLPLSHSLTSPVNRQRAPLDAAFSPKEVGTNTSSRAACPCQVTDSSLTSEASHRRKYRTVAGSTRNFASPSSSGGISILLRSSPAPNQEEEWELPFQSPPRTSLPLELQVMVVRPVCFALLRCRGALSDCLSSISTARRIGWVLRNAANRVRRSFSGSAMRALEISSPLVTHHPSARLSMS